MKKINILITAVGGDIGCNIVNIITEQKNKNISLIGTDINEHVFCHDQIDKFYVVDKVNSKNYAIQILNIIKENSIDIILPISENEILWFYENYDLFINLELKILINNKNIIDTFLDKFKTSVALNDILVQTPKTFLFDEFTNQLTFPIIIKGKYSVLSKEVQIIKNQSQLDYFRNFIEKQENYIVQEYIGTTEEEYTTCIYQNKEKTEIISFKRRLTGGMTSFAQIVNENVLNAYAKKIAQSFDLKGSINIQSRRVEDEFYIFEINPRLSSTVYIRDKFNFQDALWWINDLLEQKLFSLSDKKVSSYGDAILGYKYKFNGRKNEK
jgi:carbamoyl-phosphate synthase large subunit